MQLLLRNLHYSNDSNKKIKLPKYKYEQTQKENKHLSEQTPIFQSEYSVDY